MKQIEITANGNFIIDVDQNEKAILLDSIDHELTVLEELGNRLNRVKEVFGSETTKGYFLEPMEIKMLKDSLKDQLETGFFLHKLDNRFSKMSRQDKFERKTKTVMFAQLKAMIDELIKLKE